MIDVNLKVKIIAHPNLGFFFFFWPNCCMACGSLVPQPGSEPMSPASEMQNHSHWTTREVIT